MAKNEATLLIRIKQLGSDALDKIGSSLKAIGEVSSVVGGALFTFGAMAIKAFKESEAASNKLSQTMVQQGVYTRELKNQYDAMAESLSQKSLFEDEAITNAQAILQTQLGEIKVSKELMQATLDLAQAKGIDLASAAEMVGKSVGTSTNALARQGITITQTTDKSDRLSQAITQLNSKFGGQAEAATQGLGALDMLKKTAGEFLEAVGGRLAPVVGELAAKLNTLVTSWTANEQVMDGIMSVFQAMAQIGVVVKGVFEVVGKTIGTVLAGAFGAVSEAINGNFRAAWDNAKAIATVGTRDIAETWAKGKDEMAYINDLFLKKQEEDLTKQEEMEKQSLIRRQEQQGVFDADKAAKELELETMRQDKMIADQEQQAMQNDQKIASEIAMLDKKIAAEESYQNKKALVQQRGLLAEQQRKAIADKQALQTESMFQGQRADIIGATSNLITSISDSGSKAAFLISKAAALAQTYIMTKVAATNALATVPYPANIAAAANMETIGYINMAAIAASAVRGLATGGIVQATPGGGLFNIGEGGRDEAVIPLDDPDAMERLGGMGGRVVVNFNGPIMGDEGQAREFAAAIDRELLKLRRSNQSVAFESDVI